VSLTSKVVIVLADYQVNSSAPVHHALSFLLDHLPSQMHLLDQLSASQCNAVCATGGSQAQLDFLEQANLCLIPLRTNDAGITTTTRLLRSCVSVYGRRLLRWSWTSIVAPAADTNSTRASPRRCPMCWQLLGLRRQSA